MVLAVTTTAPRPRFLFTIRGRLAEDALAMTRTQVLPKNGCYGGMMVFQPCPASPMLQGQSIPGLIGGRRQGDNVMEKV